MRAALEWMSGTMCWEGVLGGCVGRVCWEGVLEGCDGKVDGRVVR